jgi:DNA adenine methylase
LYAMPFFTIHEVLANRAINCIGAKRGKITELVITNYPVERAIELRLLEQRVTLLEEHRPTGAST